MVLAEKWERSWLGLKHTFQYFVWKASRIPQQRIHGTNNSCLFWTSGRLLTTRHQNTLYHGYTKIPEVLESNLYLVARNILGTLIVSGLEVVL